MNTRGVSAAPIAQSAEAADLKSAQCGFESHWGHLYIGLVPKGDGADLQLFQGVLEPVRAEPAGEEPGGLFDLAQCEWSQDGGTSGVDAKRTRESHWGHCDLSLLYQRFTEIVNACLVVLVQPTCNHESTLLFT